MTSTNNEQNMMHPSADLTAALAPLLGIPQVNSEQLQSILKSLPNLVNSSGDGKDSAAAAEALQNLARSGAFNHQLPPGPPQHPSYGHVGHPHHPGMADPGPSSHPRGPPNLGQLPSGVPPGMQGLPPTSDIRSQLPDSSDDQNFNDGPPSPETETDKPKGSGRRTGRNATMSNDEWARQRKDNHKEVERRRRGNINEGINELGRIVPNGSGEKAKGAILSRAVQYIHHLKENEARNIEKWTLEKLLMDQAMGDLQAQLDEVKRAWEHERNERLRLEAEVSALKGQPRSGPASSAAAPPPVVASGPRSPEGADSTSSKRSREGGDDKSSSSSDGESKRQRKD